MVQRGVFAFGPGLVFILGAVGPRDLVSNSIAGATYGYSLLWLLVVTLAVRFVILDATARYVMVTGQTCFRLRSRRPLGDLAGLCGDVAQETPV